MISMLVFLLVLGLLIVVHEFGHFIAAKKVGVRVEKFSLGFGSRILGRKIGDTEYSLNAAPLGGYVKLAGDNLEEFKGNRDEYLGKPPAARALIIFCGPLLNYLLGIFIFWLVFFSGYPSLSTKVGGLIDELGAKEAGVLAGDRITAIDGEPVRYWEELQKAVQSKKENDTVVLSITRKKDDLKLPVRIKTKQTEDLFGQKRGVALLGVTPDTTETLRQRHGPLRSFSLSLEKTWQLTFLTYKALGRLVTGKMSMRESMTGPLGIFYITSQASRVGVVAVLHLIAVLSVSLAIFNLLPLPVLDGGHIVLLAIEKVRGKGLSARAERVVTQTGLTLIIALAIFVTYNDLLRFFGDRIAQFFK